MPKREGTQGEAFIKLSIDNRGKVDSARVLRTTHEAFGLAAKEAPMKWQFSPILKEGKPIRTEVGRRQRKVKSRRASH